ncbi:T9SS type A sorting domain-containing protein [Flavobacterium sp.]|jgi:hypothetical protein|uniref:T9SS type A sorting domain-containing protein n=1 Tax=Flavobacterium sp. TaxID=239 RepID=UPI0037BF4A81
MNKTINFFSIILFCLTINVVYAQKSVVASGGKATGTAGTASFSVGQISYKNPTGNIVSAGVQQPYEIQTLGKSDFDAIQLEMKVYPNPTEGEFQLKISDSNLKNLTYQLFDVNGKNLASQNINQEETAISLKYLNKGVYFLAVLMQNKQLKNFKIIKN